MFARSAAHCAGWDQCLHLENSYAGSCKTDHRHLRPPSYVYAPAVCYATQAKKCLLLVPSCNDHVWSLVRVHVCRPSLPPQLLVVAETPSLMLQSRVQQSWWVCAQHELKLFLKDRSCSLTTWTLPIFAAPTASISWLIIRRATGGGPLSIIVMAGVLGCALFCLWYKYECTYMQCEDETWTWGIQGRLGCVHHWKTLPSQTVGQLIMVGWSHWAQVWMSCVVVYSNIHIVVVEVQPVTGSFAGKLFWAGYQGIVDVNLQWTAIMHAHCACCTMHFKTCHAQCGTVNSGYAATELTLKVFTIKFAAILNTGTTMTWGIYLQASVLLV